MDAVPAHLLEVKNLSVAFRQGSREVLAGEMGQRGRTQVAVDNLQARRGFAQAIDDCGGNLAADGVGTQHAGVDMQ